jgi:hypothetical protein
MLTLRRGVVVAADDGREPMQSLKVQLEDSCRRALADVAMVGSAEVGDEVIVNVAALDLGLGSGGYDIVHVNLTRGLAGQGLQGAHVMKLNYSSMQHAVDPIEEHAEGECSHTNGRGVGVCFLHGQLPPLAWAFKQNAPGLRLGYVQTAGGALPGAQSRVVRELRSSGLLAGHITAGPAYGGEAEAISTAGALQAGFELEGWDVAICGPGPGILGSGSRFGHGGMVALDSAHTAAALGCEVVISPRCSRSDPRQRHRGISHHTKTVLSIALVPFTVAFPEGFFASDAVDGDENQVAPHECQFGVADQEGYIASGLPTKTMGRTIAEDPEFFLAALAAGDVLASKAIVSLGTEVGVGGSQR